MGERTCYLRFCPECDLEVAPDDEECPDCGTIL